MIVEPPRCDKIIVSRLSGPAVCRRFDAAGLESSKTSLHWRPAPDRFRFFLSPMTDPDLKTTLREFKEYVDLSYESPREIATHIGVSQPRIWDWLARKSQPKAKSLAKLRRFLDNEAKRPAQGDGIRPIEPVPYKIIRPFSKSGTLGSARSAAKPGARFVKLDATSFQGGCTKCGATGPTREGHQEALRAWNGRK
jgi:transcriptional regulator with XRE-family HTH domain